MNKNRYLNLLTLILMIVLAISTTLYSKVDYHMHHTNLKTNYTYAGLSDLVTVEDYYASSGEYYGGATLKVNESMAGVSHVLVHMDNDKIIKHSLTKIDEFTYVIDVLKVKEGNMKPEVIEIYNDQEESLTQVELKSTEGIMYSFTDDNQAWRHLYVNDAGVFLGEYTIKALSEDVDQNIVLEICTKDDTKSQGYHLLAKKQMTLSRFTSQEDLGFVGYTNQTQYDGQSNLYAIVHWSDTNIEEIPFMKGAK